MLEGGTKVLSGKDQKVISDVPELCGKESEKGLCGKESDKGVCRLRS